MSALTAPASPLRRTVGALEIPRARLLAAVLAACATLASAFALAAVSAYLVTRAWTMPPVLDLTVAVVMVRALGVSRGVLRWLERMLTHDVALRGVVSLRTNLFTALAARTDDGLTRLRRGDLLSRLGDDAQELGDHVITAVVPGLVAAVMTVVVLATFAPLSLPAAAAMLVSLLVASGIAPWASYRAARLAEQAVVTSRAQVGAQALTILDDATALQVQGRLDGAVASLRTRQAEHDLALDRAALPAAVAAAAVPLAMILAVTGSLLAAGALWVDGGASAGQIGILLLLPLSSFEAVTALPAAAAQLARSRAAAARLDALSGDVHDRPAPADAPDPAPAPAPERPHTAALRAVGLTAGWSPDAPRVTGLDLELPPGARLAVVGPSGCGKSTLLATLAGLLDPLAGRVELDGEPLPGWSVPEIRAGVTMFAEDGHVFATTVRENLRVVRGDLGDDTARAALSAVGLDDWLEALPRGLDTMLGPDGTTISGGERRRLLLARAVVRRGPILLLDEPTEHLDTARGDALLRALLDPRDTSLVPADSTVVVVTHRVEAVPADTPILRLEETR
ncbi:thiol reductant ABC exporter subunit CydC [Brachybacterium saurashtrense]|uniref:Thiol reductant ABC exporter subunit CydC n=1 Tax=Brachybacterium saurashtrense TaxID=556288 RepID=A0A345YN15_9MICO|nr:thiol reductant ABC exporter subunit CydC [Brachybacterium saurashtrense]AXK45317.1 thiol reductant ABC exporter subunit CydC [Brachybacterium saurashtrense]RRR21926.1 thiol reductant ABC exporter subunit CydC [Brachybacterium saurashtrense]